MENDLNLIANYANTICQDLKQGVSGFHKTDGITVNLHLALIRQIKVIAEKIEKEIQRKQP